MQVIKLFVGIIEKQADAHRVLQTLNFSDEFDEKILESKLTNRIFDKLAAKEVRFSSGV